MLEKVIGLFERLVIAMETQAVNQAAYLEFQKEMGATYVAADPQPEAPKAEIEKPKTTRAKKEKPAEPEAPKVEETKPKLTLADVKIAVGEYAKARLDSGSPSPKEDARALMAHFAAGATKTDLIEEPYWQDVVDACKSGWEPLPAKDEEL